MQSDVIYKCGLLKNIIIEKHEQLQTSAVNSMAS